MENEIIVIPEKKKRGRKPNPEKKKDYFSDVEQQAVIDYLNAETKEEKDKIFSQYLHKPFIMMIESIIRRYFTNKFKIDEDFDTMFYDTYSFLLTKFDKYDPTSGYKAYSYYQTIIKNYLNLKHNNYTKNSKRNISYQDISSDVDENEDYMYSIEDGSPYLTQVINDMIDNIHNVLNGTIKLKLNKNEIKLGHALLDLLTNWEDLFIHMGSTKFNKFSILYFLKETTFLTTKEIRDGMKKYKVIYAKVKNNLL